MKMQLIVLFTILITLLNSCGVTKTKLTEKDNVSANGEGYKDGIFIHSSNSSGYAGEVNGGKSGISVGCLLIAPGDWKGFNDAMNGVKNFKVQVSREFIEKVPLQGVRGPVPGVSFINQHLKTDYYEIRYCNIFFHFQLECLWQ